MSNKQPRKIQHNPHQAYKTPSAKPLSQTSKTILLISAAVLLLAGIWYFFIYDDGSLPVKNGVIQAGGDNWVIVNRGTTSDPQYYKLAEVGPIEGYTRDTDNTYKSDKNTTDFILMPDDAQSLVKYCYISGVTSSSKDASASAREALGKQFGSEGISENRTGTFGGYFTEYFIASSSYQDDNGITRYLQQLNCYLAYDKANSILFNVTVSTDDQSKLLDEEYLLQIAAAGAKAIEINTDK